MWDFLDWIYYNRVMQVVQEYILLLGPFLLVIAGIFDRKLKKTENAAKRKKYTIIVLVLLSVVLVNFFVFIFNNMRHFADHL